MTAKDRILTPNIERFVEEYCTILFPYLMGYKDGIGKYRYI